MSSTRRKTSTKSHLTKAHMTHCLLRYVGQHCWRGHRSRKGSLETDFSFRDGWSKEDGEFVAHFISQRIPSQVVLFLVVGLIRDFGGNYSEMIIPCPNIYIYICMYMYVYAWYVCPKMHRGPHFYEWFFNDRTLTLAQCFHVLHCHWTVAILRTFFKLKLIGNFSWFIIL